MASPETGKTQTDTRYVDSVVLDDAPSRKKTVDFFESPSSASKRSKPKFSADTHPSIWIADNSKTDYKILDVVQASGRRSNDRSYYRKVKLILEDMGIEPGGILTAQQVIEAAVNLGPPRSTGGNISEKEANEILREIGAISQDPKKTKEEENEGEFAKIARLIEEKQRRGRRHTAHGESNEKVKVDYRERIGVGLTEKILHAINISTHMNSVAVRMDRNVSLMLTGINLPKRYNSALRILKPQQADRYLISLVREKVDMLWDQSEIENSGLRKIIETIEDLKDKNILKDDVLRFLYSHFRVGIPADDALANHESKLVTANSKTRHPSSAGYNL